MSVRKGDTVKITIGKDRGKEGKITMVNPSKGTAIVEGLNMVKRHCKPQRQSKGGIMDKEAPIQISNLKKIQAAE